MFIRFFEVIEKVRDANMQLVDAPVLKFEKSWKVDGVQCGAGGRATEKEIAEYQKEYEAFIESKKGVVEAPIAEGAPIFEDTPTQAPHTPPIVDAGNAGETTTTEGH